METNFASLTPKQKIVWARDVWAAARDKMFTKKFTGTSDNAMIQRITDLTKTEKGEEVLMHLVADLVEDGGVGDNEREGNEEEMKSYNQTITIDLINHGVRNKGKMADQKTVINFRKYGRDRLAYWLANRVDQLVFLTLSGISYAYHNDGRPRVNSAFPNLAFAADVSAPTSKRALMWTTAGGLAPSSTATLAATDTITYKTIVDLKAYANEHYIRPLMAGGKEYFVCLLRPGSFAQLKKDADFQRAVTTAMPRSENNPWFTGGTVTIDGIVFHEHRLVYTNRGAGAGNMWGAGNNVAGTRTLLCGAQALGFADLGAPEWSEKKFQYDSVQGINVDKMFGLLKPKFFSIYDNSVEDFGVLTLDHAA